MASIIVIPANKKERDELKEFLTKKKIFSKENKSPYNPEFVKMILSQPKRGRVIDPHKVWENIK